MGLMVGQNRLGLQDREAPITKRRQQGGGMMWAGICGDKLIGPYKVDDGVKLTSETYCKFLDKTFFKWYKSQSRSFKTKCVFMHYIMLHHMLLMPLANF